MSSGNWRPFHLCLIVFMITIKSRTNTVRHINTNVNNSSVIMKGREDLETTKQPHIPPKQASYEVFIAFWNNRYSVKFPSNTNGFFYISNLPLDAMLSVLRRDCNPIRYLETIMSIHDIIRIKLFKPSSIWHCCGGHGWKWIKLAKGLFYW